jgi:hypothetical protein
MNKFIAAAVQAASVASYPFKAIAVPEPQTAAVGEASRAARTRARFGFDAIGHYARPDTFNLLVNDQPMPAVAFSSAE